MCWSISHSLPSAEKKKLPLSVPFGLFLPQAQLLKELEHRATQEARHWQQLDLMKSSSMEKLLEDVEQKEQHLQLLTEEAERASKLDQLQQKKIQRELRQVSPGRLANRGAISFFPSLPGLSCLHSGAPPLCHHQAHLGRGNIYTWAIAQAAYGER